MRKNLLIAAVAFFTGMISYAQETVVWGTQVVDVSSEYSPLEYSAIQALHKPNVYPGGGDNANAWRAKNENSDEFVMVSFDKPIKAKQVAIAETENPGAVTKVYAYDGEYNEYTLFDLTPRPIPIESRLLNLFFEDTPYEIYAIKVFLDGEAVPGYNAIDAIGISSSNLPISVLINLAAGMAQGKEADKLGADVNSSYAEHSPIISPDGKHLYFSRRYHPDNVGGVDDVEDIWVSDKDPETGEWLPAKNVGPPLNTPGPNFITSVTMVEGEEVLLLGNRYGKKGRMYSGVSSSKRSGDKFEKPSAIEIENDYNYAPKVDYFLTESGESMILSAERDDSYGGRDLYVSWKKGNIWSEPKNLGKDINTASDDFSPFLAQDGKILYFSSSGYRGYGGSDIYVSIRLDDSWEKWSAPENLGSSVNSKGDDQYFSIPASGQHIYFSRGDMDDDTDIFRFKADDIFIDKTSKLYSSISHLREADLRPDDYIRTIYGRVIEATSKVGMSEVEVILERLPDGLEMGKVMSGANGKYSLGVRGGAKYGMTARLQGYISTDENFDLNKLSANDSAEVNLQLSVIKAGTSIVLNNIFFEFNKTTLTTSSYSELKRLVDLLKRGEIQKVEVSGHTDSVGDEDYNQKLSERRAQAVVNYITTSGISSDRIVAVGYGEAEPIAPNDTKANQAKNRRVEFKISE
ncbi:MAG: OmpA family protein [Cyclobacteriaceae bacterium]